MKKLGYIGILIGLLFVLTACTNNVSNHEGHDMSEMKESEEKSSPTEAGSQSRKVITDNEFTITAQEGTLQINENNENVTLPVWTFDGSVPGSEIRVQEGEELTIHLKNELPEPVTIHWHGVPVPNNIDGIPGVTMNAVQPGETFTYNFTAEEPGTYWYHSHQDGVNQVDKGLYGSFIVEPKNSEEVYDKDYVLMLDEWMSEETSSSDMSSMDHSGMNMESSEGHEGMSMDQEEGHSEPGEMGHDMRMYDLFTINGKSGSSVEPLLVENGDKVRLRFINAGFMSHKIHVHGHDIKVISSDGQEIVNPALFKDQLISIAPGERYDVVFEAGSEGQWYIECHGDMEGTKGMKALIQYNDDSEMKDQENDEEELSVFDLTKYGESKDAEFTLDQSYDVEYTMNLNTEMKQKEMVFTINGKAYPETEGVKVKEGDLVKVKFVNNSKTDDHPMHLHGHFFQVLSKNGEPIQGSPLIKDTLNVKPGEEYVVAFKADNPGNWMFHCHDLHHAAAGMVSHVNYEDYKSDFTPDPHAHNKPE
ncbi:multicopper oxidase family protein [Bacillus taeanensis]|uniref:Multicopper oxidase family protein n=1 Tax=Bacillus taeanensis TaxID=273032 RepID=A0A366XX20_9BACI|nr:multicopper oxidase family protein [Bacillus taeanensis]RBW70186.1 multicopper oxidase family protein [Bacillus taeanensis]